MPIGTPVEKMYQALLKQGYSKKDAAKEAQAKTGLALRTGLPPKRTRGGTHAKRELKVKGIRRSRRVQ